MMLWTWYICVLHVCLRAHIHSVCMHVYFLEPEEYVSMFSLAYSGKVCRSSGHVCPLDRLRDSVSAGGHSNCFDG